MHRLRRTGIRVPPSHKREISICGILNCNNSEKEIEVYQFAKKPTSDDFLSLESYLRMAGKDAIHPSLWETRERVADGLRDMSQQPIRQEYLSVYHALRLFVW